MGEDSSQNVSQPPNLPLDYAGPASRRPRLDPRTWIALALAIAAAAITLGYSLLLMGSGWEVHLLVMAVVLALLGAALRLALAGRRRDRAAGVGRPVAILILGISLVTLALLAMRSIPRGPHVDRETPTRVICASKLRQISQACVLYANANGGAFPDKLERLIEYEDISADIFCCPKAKTVQASGATTQAIVADFQKPGRCSYIYVGSGLTMSSSPAAIVAYEPASNHDGDGANVVYQSCAVEFVPPAILNHYLAEIAAGQNPPRPPTTKPGR